MGRMIALKTLEAIKTTLEADQGNSYRYWLGQLLPTMHDIYRQDDNGFRSHLGASVIGQECARAVWYGFHWTYKEVFSERILRLFNRGHMEEARFLACLLAIGCKVYQQDENGKQFKISDFEGHFGGSGDGIVEGLPDLPPDTLAVVECKTHGSKSFADLVKKGVRESKFEHYVQTNIYMRKMGYAAALYFAVNKDNDEFYAEILYLDSVTADQYVDRAGKIIALPSPPKKLSDSPGFYKCSWCSFKGVCHLKQEPAVNCRTCVFSQPGLNAQFYCRQYNVPLSKEQQELGCQSYTRNPGI